MESTHYGAAFTVKGHYGVITVFYGYYGRKSLWHQIQITIIRNEYRTSKNRPGRLFATIFKKGVYSSGIIRRRQLLEILQLGIS